MFWLLISLGLFGAGLGAAMVFDAVVQIVLNKPDGEKSATLNK